MFGPFGCVLHYEPCNICAVLLALVIGWPFTMCCWGRRRAGFVRQPALTMVQIQQQDCLPVHQATGMAQQQQQQTTIVLPRIAGGAAATAVNYPAAQQTMNPLAANQKKYNDLPEAIPWAPPSAPPAAAVQAYPVAAPVRGLSQERQLSVE